MVLLDLNRHTAATHTGTTTSALKKMRSLAVPFLHMSQTHISMGFGVSDWKRKPASCGGIGATSAVALRFFLNGVLTRTIQFQEGMLGAFLYGSLE